MGFARIKAEMARILGTFGLKRSAAVVLSVFVLLLILITAGSEDMRLALRYDRTGIEAGQVWRLLTGHAVHLGWNHLWLNVAGLILAGLLFGSVYRAGGWLAITAVAMAAMAIGFWHSGLVWYVGLSGLLHGVFLAGALRWVSEGQWDGYVLITILVAKLAWEQLVGPMPFSESSAGGPVVVDAHLYGAIGGVLGAVAAIAFERLRGRV